ncbi:uncharacterized protein LOC113239432 [Hyposmocoma kahamanoa]|uniref:uncharacterized protein LOC113239432 n=1 Tax=Hyposmocoma kahamanoa TaxID=1477025 RepID=UPI000E6D701B|nr:uncharacterized protein LOC113239432 [Hyposmocoma kahamanoa]
MTSTPFNVGIAEGKRPTSRVLYPPGGKHTDIFGVDPEPPRYGKRQGFQVTAAQNSETATATNGTATSDKAKPVTLEACNASQEVMPEAKPDTSCNEASVTAESAGPVETAAPQIVASAQTQAPTATSETTIGPVTTTKRVRVPPGGFSSQLW